MRTLLIAGIMLVQFGGTGPYGTGGSGPSGTGGSWPRPADQAPQYVPPMPTTVRPVTNGAWTVTQPGSWPTICRRVGQSVVCR